MLKYLFIIVDNSIFAILIFIQECYNASKDGTSMICYSPRLPNDTIPVGSSAGRVFRYAFQMDNIIINRTAEDPLDTFTIFGDPVFKTFPGNKEMVHKQKAEYLTISVSLKTRQCLYFKITDEGALDVRILSCLIQF